MKKRDMQLDALRGGAAILVVLGHCIQYRYIESFTQIYAFNLIYSFHMVFFMIISGYASGYSEISDTWMKKRTARLLVPYFVWMIIRYGMANSIQNYSISACASSMIHIILDPPSGGLWFLWILWINCCVLWLCSKFSAKEKLLVFACIVCVVLDLVNWEVRLAGIKYVVQYLPMFLGGYLLKDNVNLKENAEKCKNGMKKYKMIPVLCILFFIWIVSFLEYGSTPKCLIFLYDCVPKCIADGLVGVFVKIFLPILGSVCFYFLVEILPYSIKKGMGIIGLYTLEIYVLHTQLLFQVLTRILSRFAVMEIAFKTVVMIVACMGIAYLTKRMKYVRFILWGIYK